MNTLLEQESILDFAITEKNQKFFDFFLQFYIGVYIAKGKAPTVYRLRELSLFIKNAHNAEIR